jgi:prevent-host-death family protein
MPNTKPHRVWTVAEAKARLSEILRLAETEGPQRIGARKPFVVVPAQVWAENVVPRVQLGRWLIENTPRDTGLEIPGRHDRGREIPFINEADA